MKIDFKIIIIIVLLLGVVGMIFFWPSDNGGVDQKELDRLERENESLMKMNDSLKVENAKLDEIIFNANEAIEDLNIERDSLDVEIKKLKKRRNEARDHVNSLNDSDVIRGLSDYLERRGN